MISRPAKDSPESKTPAIVDTGFLVAFARTEDRHHDWAKAVAVRLQLPLLTCEAVLAETSFMLQSSAYVLAMLRREVLTVAFDCGSNVGHLINLAVHYADRKPDLADLCLIRMSELFPRHTIVTVDGDFLVYRRNRREAIPVLTPHENLG